MKGLQVVLASVIELKQWLTDNSLLCISSPYHGSPSWLLMGVSQHRYEEVRQASLVLMSLLCNWLYALMSV